MDNLAAHPERAPGSRDSSAPVVVPEIAIVPSPVVISRLPIIPASIVVPGIAIIPPPVGITETALIPASIVIPGIATPVITEIPIIPASVILLPVSLQSRQDASQAILQVL